MIARPTARQPWIQALLVLTLSVLVCYSFTTARAQEKEVPPKERTRDSSRSGTTPAAGEEDGVKKPGDREREGDGAVRKPGMREGDDGAKKPGMRDGEGSTKKPGARDGEGERKPGMKDGERRAGDRDGDGEGGKKPGMRDGERPRTGEREGDGGRKPGMRDGEKTRTGERDGEKSRTGERDGEKPRSKERDGERPSTGARDGEGSRKTGNREGAAATSTSDETITVRIIKQGDAVLIGDEEIAMSRLRGYLSRFLPDHPGAKVVVAGEADTPYKAVTGTLDALRDNGSKNIEIQRE